MDNLPYIYDRWVKPVYMGFLHGNFRHILLAEEPENDWTATVAEYRRCVAEIDRAVVETLLRQPEWRARLAGAWYAGLRGWKQFAEGLGDLLVESRMCFACQGYCAALACFANDASAEYLRRYLEVWLPQRDKYYDQHWALPALVWVDKRLDTQHAASFLEAGGLWDQWAGANHRDGAAMYQDAQRNFDLTLASALAAFRAT